MNLCCKRSILFLLSIVYKNVEGSCYYYSYDSHSHEYCYNPYTPAFGASYVSVVVIGVLVSLIVWWYCTKKKNQQGCYCRLYDQTAQRTSRMPVSYQCGNQQNQSGNRQNQNPEMAGVHGIENPFFLMEPTQQGNSQGQTNTPWVFSSSSQATENLLENVQTDNTKPDSD